MIEKTINLLVGPTDLPHRVKMAMTHDVISHRGQYYYDAQREVMEGMKKIFGTKSDILVQTCSGTGAMESVIQNLFVAGDKVVVPITGEFSRLFYQVAEPYGLDITTVNFDYGEVADVNKVMEAVTPDTKAVLLIHNESSTGALNDIEAFGNALKDTETLLVVDSVSAAAGVEIQMDNWHIDVVITASQKCLMAPPGMAFVALSDAAWDRVEEVENNSYYFNFRKDRKYTHQDRTVHTPATHTLLAIRESLRMLEEEGLENVYQRHKDNAAYVREKGKELGLELMVKDDSHSAPPLTCFYTPGKAKYYISELAKRNIIVGGGKTPLGDDTFRIGTMGFVSMNEVVACMEALKEIVESEKIAE